MNTRHWLFGLDRTRMAGMAGLVLVTVLVIFTYLNVAVEPHVIKTGTVTALGLDTSTRSELTRQIATLEIDGQRVTNIEIPRQVPLRVGDRVEVYASRRLITAGETYRFGRVLK